MTVTLVTNPSQRPLPGVAEQVLVLGADALHYLHMVAGSQLESMARMQGTPSLDSVLQLYRVLSRRRTTAPGAESAAHRLRNPYSARSSQTRLRFSQPVLWRNAVSQPPIYLGGLVGRRLDRASPGTLRRLVSTPGSLTAFLAGKMLSSLLLLAVVVTFAPFVGALLLASRSAACSLPFCGPFSLPLPFMRERPRCNFSRAPRLLAMFSAHSSCSRWPSSAEASFRSRCCRHHSLRLVAPRPWVGLCRDSRRFFAV